MVGKEREALVTTDEDEDGRTQALTPALVREVAEKVYTLWIQDLRIERERLGLRRHQPLQGQGRK
jgi:hypothetical protein